MRHSCRRRRQANDKYRIWKLASLAILLLPLTAYGTGSKHGKDCIIEQIACTNAIRSKVTVQADEWKDGNKPRRMLARIQSNLDRVSAGQQTWPSPAGAKPDPLLKIVDAYAYFLHGDFKTMDAQLAIVESSAKMSRGSSSSSWEKENADFYKNYVAATHSPSPLVRLYAGLRVVDGALFKSFGNPFNGESGDPWHAHGPLGDTWLRLPCRTVIGRVKQFQAAASSLKALGGPVLDCPVNDLGNYTHDEQFALHPEHLRLHVVKAKPVVGTALTNTPKPPPGSRAAAIAEMGTAPQKAAPILKHYAQMNMLGKLDYLLFLHAFEPETKARNTTIRRLQAALYKKAKSSPRRVFDFPLTPYNGSDASLVSTIQMASETGVAITGYTIPCAILLAHPVLLDATDSYYGSNRDNFMPRSGCLSGYGGHPPAEFPEQAISTFETAATKADGNFLATMDGSMVYGLIARQKSTYSSVQLDPHFFLQPRKYSYPSAPFDYPYQVWGYTSLHNYVVSLHVRKLYRAAHSKLAKYYQKQMGLTPTKSRLAAKRGLFALVFGASCGGSVPSKSLRRMLLEHAPVPEIKQALHERPVDAQDNLAAWQNETSQWFGGERMRHLYGSKADAPQIDYCANYADLDPLLLIAVGYPKAFSLVLLHQPNINVRNAIGKTALMVAAQFNQLSVAKQLLAHHAAVNATTQDSSYNHPLGDDARTALMYAAANGSLKMIRTLLEAGADPFQADTKGYRAIDYLLGYGPTSPNPLLSKQQRQQVARWLF